MQNLENDTKDRDQFMYLAKKKVKSSTDVNNFTITEDNSQSNELMKSPSNEASVNEGITNEDVLVQKKSKKSPRKTRKESKGRAYICTICDKGYLSYPALYTHKRNKHNIIPITGKPEIFKIGQNNTNKFRYNVLDCKTNLRINTQALIEEFTQICNSFYLNKESTLYNPKFNPEDDSIIKLLKFYYSSNLENVKVPKIEEKEKLFINNILVIYLILLTEVTRDKYFVQIIVKFVFLFREYLNLAGWDYLLYLNQYGLFDNLQISGEFCERTDCEELPELVNDFLNIFLEMEPMLKENIKSMTDLTKNFCYWLFINGLTNYKLSKYETSGINC